MDTEQPKNAGNLPSIQSTTYQLSSEDYENIWLRVKEKGKHWVLGWVSFIVGALSFIAVFGVYNYAKNSIDTAVQKYTSSPEFKSEIQRSFLQKTTELNDSLSQLSKKLKDAHNSIDNKLLTLKSAPFQIQEHGFVLIDSTGRKTIVEYGSEKIGEKIKFSSRFSTGPLLITSIRDSTFIPSPSLTAQEFRG